MRHPSPLKIALIMDCPLLQNGGVELLVRALSLNLPTYFPIVLVTPEPENSIPQSYLDVIDAHISLPSPFTVSAAANLVKSLRRQGVQLAHFHLGGTYSLKLRSYFQCPLRAFVESSFPYLITNHGVFGFYGYCGATQPLLFKWAVLPYFYTSRSYFIAKSKGEWMVSKNDLAKMQRWFWPLKHRFGVIYHSLMKTSNRVPSNSVRKKRFLCVGTVGHRKGQWLLTRAFADVHEQIPEWRLTIVGRFATEELKIKTLAPIRDPSTMRKVDIIDNATDQEVEDFYKTSEIFVIPSLEEGLGLTLQEALFHGCACISTRAGGTEDLVEDGDNGIMVNRGSAKELGDAMVRLARDSALREKFTTRGPSSIAEKEMTVELMVKKYAEIYRNIPY